MQRDYLLILGFHLFLTSCGENEIAQLQNDATSDQKAGQKIVEPWTHIATAENISVAEIAENSKLDIITETTAEREAREIREKTLSLVDAGDFTALDEMAETLLKTKERDADGAWNLTHFYSTFDLARNLPTVMWERQLAFLETWMKTRPDSQTARIALADFLTGYAWRARGSGYANTVTDEGWRLMGERLQAAGAILGSAIENLEITDPVFYQVALRVMLGTNGPPSTFDNLVAGSLKIASDYWASLDVRAYSLLPRWYGQSGDWEAFAKFIAEENKPHGKEQYAILVLRRHSFDNDSVSRKRLDWNLFKESARELFKNYPDSVTNLSRVAFIATHAEDREFAKECFELLGDRCDPDVWEVNGRMCHYRNWARTGNW